MPTDDFWLLFVANLPIVVVLLIAQQKGWWVLGITHNKEIETQDDNHRREIENKDKEIIFREQLRQEAIVDRDILSDRDGEKTEALRELTNVVKQTLELNDRLLNETLDKRWDGRERREPSSRTRRGT